MAIAERVTAASIEASVDLKGHLDSVGSLLERYGLEDGRKRQCKAALEKIHARRTDPDLYLAIIGEFSSGKSTLVNALIGQELLPADVLPATTAAATLVRYGKSPALRVEYTDGRHEEFRDRQLRARGQSLRDLVTRFTAVEEVARTVARVTVDSPAPVLRKGLVAVDMPGSNVENRRHVELAGWAIRDMCDVALVAIPANIPAAETLIAFLKTHLEDSLHRCIFVATKIDLIAPRERPRVLATIAGRLSVKLGISQPLVLSASATAALGEPLPNGTDASTPGEAGETYRKLQTEFHETAETIARTLQEQRTLILLERLSALLSDLLEGLEQDLQAMERRYQADHEALEANRIRELEPYIAESKKRHRQALTEQIDPLIRRARKIIGEACKKALANLKSLVNAAEDRDALQAIGATGANDLLAKSQKKLEEKLGSVLQEIANAAQQQVQVFETEFGQLYRSLQSLGGRIVFDGTGERKALTRGGKDGVAPGLQAVLSQVQQDEEEENTRMGALAVVGAVASFFLPGGPILYVLGGALLGWLCGPPIEELRQTCWDRLRPEVTDHYSEIESAVQQQLQKIRKDLRHQLNQTIDRHFVEYDSLVQRMFAADQAQAEDLARRRRHVRKDLAELRRRREDLQQARAGLQKIQKL
ncbi:MAG TPA: dynamin family protein [Thermoanaerobaculia bacterium]